MDASVDARIGLDGGRDAALPAGVTVSPDGKGYCCPVGFPSCECMPMGGFTTDPAWCEFNWVCDAHPNDWRLTVDAHGCANYEVGMMFCCNCPFEDGGADGGDGDASD